MNIIPSKKKTELFQDASEISKAISYIISLTINEFRCSGHNHGDNCFCPKSNQMDEVLIFLIKGKTLYEHLDYSNGRPELDLETRSIINYSKNGILYAETEENQLPGRDSLIIGAVASIEYVNALLLAGDMNLLSSDLLLTELLACYDYNYAFRRIYFALLSMQKSFDANASCRNIIDCNVFIALYTLLEDATIREERFKHLYGRFRVIENVINNGFSSSNELYRFQRREKMICSFQNGSTNASYLATAYHIIKEGQMLIKLDVIDSISFFSDMCQKLAQCFEDAGVEW